MFLQNYVCTPASVTSLQEIVFCIQAVVAGSHAVYMLPSNALQSFNQQQQSVIATSPLLQGKKLCKTTNTLLSEFNYLSKWYIENKLRH